MDNVKFDTYRENIREIWEDIGAIKVCVSIIEGKLGIEHNIGKTKEELNADYEKWKEDYYNDVCIDSQYGTVSKYNPIRSLDNPPLECFENKYNVPSTQACDVKENHYNERN